MIKQSRGRGAWAWVAVASLVLVTSGCGNFFHPSSTTTGSTGTGTGTGTGGTTTPTGSGYFYVGDTNPGLNTIAAFSFNGTSLAALSNSPYPISLSPTTMALTPNNAFLYAGYGYGGVYAYALTNGALSIANSGSAVDASDLPQAIAIDLTGKYLLMQQLTSTGSVISVFAINQTTAALTVVGSPLSFNQGGAGQIYFVPNTNLVYVTEGSGGMDAMSFNATTGVLASLNQHLNLSAGASADTNVTSDPAGKYLYVSETGTNIVRAFTITPSTGALAANGTVSPGLGPNALLVDSTGAYLYVALHGAAGIAAYSLSATGTLTELAGSPYSTGTLPVSLAEDHSESYLLVGNEGGNPDFQVFAIGSATAAAPGGLTSVATANTGGSIEPAIVSTVIATH